MPVYQCPCYTFEFLSKAVQIRYEKDSTITRQLIPFTQILSVRLDSNTDDKLHSLTLLLHESIKYSYAFKNLQEAEKIYDQFTQALLQ
jgi:hypothetical protein